MKDFFQRYQPVIVFYLLACLFSWPFFFWRDVHPESWNSLHLHSILKISLVMWGPGLSAILCSLIYRNKIQRTITFWGSSIVKSILFWAVPMALYISFGFNGNEASYGNFVIYLLGTFIFTLGEELGWRGYLQDQLNHLPKWKRYLIIGAMWEIWHFTTRTLSGTISARVLRPLLFIFPNSVLSWVFGESVNRSKSIVVAVTLHSWFNLLFEFPNTRTYIIFAVAVPFWILMLVKWDKWNLRRSKRTVLENEN